MKRNLKIIGLFILLLLQSCYFGAGLVEQSLTNNYSLFANNSIDEMSIWLHVEKYSSQLIVPETVFAVGYNKNYIIAKSHPKDIKKNIDKNITHYYIINIHKQDQKQSPNLTAKEFENERNRLNISKELDFNIIFEEIK